MEIEALYCFGFEHLSRFLQSRILHDDDADDDGGGGGGGGGAGGAGARCAGSDDDDDDEAEGGGGGGGARGAVSDEEDETGSQMSVDELGEYADLRSPPDDAAGGRFDQQQPARRLRHPLEAWTARTGVGSGRPMVAQFDEDDWLLESAPDDDNW